MDSEPSSQRVWKIFEEALERPSSERLAWASEACAGDSVLRSEVEKLVVAHEQDGGVPNESSPTLTQKAVVGARQPAAPDERVGPYRILSEIGRGGMGVVYKAEDPRLGRFVALKFLPLSLTADELAKRRLLAEARAASKLDHPNICTVHDIRETQDGRLFFAMAHYEGRPLSNRIAEGPLPVDEALEISRQIACGLAHAHKAGVIHRDIKPSNILLTERGEVKILDFGLAKHELAPLSEAGTRIGTVAYMSPEQAKGAGIDRRTDLWSLGAVLYEMATGRRPFQGHHAEAIMYAILREDPTPLTEVRTGVPLDVEWIVRKALAKNPDDRYQHADDLAVDLRKAREALESGSARGAVAFPPQPVRNLPSYLTSFVGREHEIREIKHLLASARLLTLTGPGGTGKTRLSLQTASEVAERFPDGVCFVSLAAITDPGLVSSAIAGALDVPPSPGLPILDDVKTALQSKSALLVLDNFEQVLDAAPAVAELLSACSGLRILVTSRAALQLSGEQEFPVPPLGLPREGELCTPEMLKPYSAVKLFVERAQAARPDFALTEQNAQDVAELCICLDGLPLAIELAAARIKLFSPKALLVRLSQRLDLLKAGTRDQPARHRTLRQAIAWSYDLLDEPARRFFRRLSIFAGGWTLEAADALCAGDVELESNAFDLLSALADQSLIRQTEGPDGEPRFWMLETIRAYAAECLQQAGEEVAAGRTHAEHFLALAERAGPELTGAEQARWLDRLEADYDNFRAAFRWICHSGNTALGMRLAAALWRFWIARGHIDENLPLLEPLLAQSEEQDADEARVRALNALGTLYHYRGDLLKARTTLEGCLKLGRKHDYKRAVAQVLTNLAWVHSELSELTSGQALSEEALALNEQLGEKRGIALALNNLGWVANYVGDYRKARSFHERSLALRLEIGDQRGIAFALTNLAWAEQYHGNLDRASELLDEAMAILRPLNDPVLIGWTLLNQARVSRDRGKLDRVVRLLEERLACWPVGSHPTILAWTQTHLGAVLCELGDPERGQALLANGLRNLKQIHCPWGIALNLCEQGKTQLGLDDEKASELVQESLKIRGEIGDRRGVAECLEILAELSFRRKDPERATLLLAAAVTLREEIQAVLPAGQREHLEHRMETLRCALNHEEFKRAQQRGSTLSLEEVLALAQRSKRPGPFQQLA